MTTGYGSIYISYSEDPKASPLVFASLGKAGGCAGANLEAITSMISLAFTKGATNEDAAKKIQGIRCPSIAWEEGKAVFSCTDEIGTALSEARE